MTKKTKLLAKVTIAVAIAAGVAFALYLLFHTKETHITTTELKKTRAFLFAKLAQLVVIFLTFAILMMLNKR